MPEICQATDVIDTLVTGESKLTDVVGEIGEIAEGLEEDELGLPWASQAKAADSYSDFRCKRNSIHCAK